MSGAVRGHNGWVVWRNGDANDGVLGYTRAEVVTSVVRDGSYTYLHTNSNSWVVDATPEEIMLIIELEEGGSKSTSEIVVEQAKEIRRLRKELDRFRPPVEADPALLAQ